jgi:hypothetical protein
VASLSKEVKLVFLAFLAGCVGSCSKAGRVADARTGAHTEDATVETEDIVKENEKDAESVSYHSDLPDAGTSQPDFSPQRPDLGRFDVKKCFSFVPDDWCEGDFPVPDTPCEREGVVRCTNEGAKRVWGDLMYRHCERTNYVRCEKNDDGSLVWKMYPVPQSLAKDPKAKVLCQENERGTHFCQDTIIVDGGCVDGVFCSPELVICESFMVHHPFCDGSLMIDCVYPEEVQDEGIKKLFVETFLREYKEFANCRYRWPTVFCRRTVPSCVPGGWEDDDPSNDIYEGICITNEDCTIRCGVGSEICAYR